MASKIDLKNAVIKHGMMIIPGHKPNSAPKSNGMKIGRDGRVPKKFALADREHGVVSGPVIGAGIGLSVHPDPKISEPIHSGMHFRERKQLNAGISRTQVVSPTDDTKFAAGFAQGPAQTDVHEMPMHHSQTGGIAALAGRRLPAQIKK